jgi:hypothetical protein
LGSAHSILGLGFTAARGLSGRYPVRILVGGSTSARIRVDGSCSPTVPANCLAPRVFYAVLPNKFEAKNIHTIINKTLICISYIPVVFD